MGRYSQEAREASGWAGWIEDEEQTWIAFIDVDGKPTFYLDRDDSGGVK